MASKIFVNLPVKDLDRSVAFFTALGYRFNPQFTDENATCMVVDEESIFVMLLVEPFFRGFTDRAVCDTATSIEAIIALSLDSRDEVDAMLEKALAAGGREPRPAQDLGFGHLWEYFHMADMPPQ